MQINSAKELTEQTSEIGKMPGSMINNPDRFCKTK
jgi:hypothetical protein